MKAKKIRFKLAMIFVGALFLMGVSSAQAFEVLIDGSGTNATGISDLDVDGTFYDVAFLFTTGTILYGPIPGSIFDFSGGDEFTANTAVLDALNSKPLVVTVGPNTSSSYMIGADTSPIPPKFLGPQGVYEGDNWANGANGSGIGIVDENEPTTWADFSEAAPVPLPGAVWLLGSGLVGLLGFRRRFNR